MNDDGYEYRLAKNNVRKIMVRKVGRGAGQLSHWKLYMECSSEEHSTYILRLLQKAEFYRDRQQEEDAVRE